MRVNPILADQLDEAFDPSEIDHQGTANEGGSGMNGELVREAKAPLIQVIKTTSIGEAEATRIEQGQELERQELERHERERRG